MKTKQLAKNKRAYFDYELKDEFVAGIQLLGQETKSARNGGVSLKGAYVTLKDNEAWILNAHIRKYEFANDKENSYDPERTRKLLLHKREIAALQRAYENKLTIVPLTMFLAGPYIKLRIATARGKKLRDKRSTIQSREADIDAQREMKNLGK